MTLHDKIMRMPHGTNEAVYSERSDWLAYKTGHRDARHAAAELAIAQDALVAQLVEALERISMYRAFNGDDWPAQQARAALISHKGER